MYQFKELLRKIRDSAGLKQEELATALGVSAILISMIETGQKEASKAFVIKLAEKMDVRPSSLMPFVMIEEGVELPRMSSVEKALIGVGEKLQMHLVDVKAKNLKKYAKEA